LISLKTVGRFFQLLAVIVRNSGRFLMERLALPAKKARMTPAAYEDELWRLKGRAARILFEQLGPTFIKLAQIMSTRRDLFPPAALKEFEKLQDDVPPFDGSQVPAIFERDFGRSVHDVFARFEPEPVASASVAQVHRAVLKNGKEVAVKVLRPGIEEIMTRDVEILNLLARFMAGVPFLKAHSLVGFTEYFGEMLKKQLDLTIEAQNNVKFRKALHNDSQAVRFPALFPEYCSRNVMTMEFAHGVKPTELDLGNTDTKRLAATGLYLYYAMVCYGLVHADLHPGNMLVSPNGFFWVFDLGLVDEMDWELRKGFFEAWFSTFNGDGGPFARLMLRFSVSNGVEDMETFESDVKAFLRKHVTLRRISDLEFGSVMMAMGDLQRKYRIVAEPAWTSIAVSLVSVEGLARHFDPDMNIVRTISPHLKKFLRKLYLMDPRLKRTTGSVGQPARHL